MPAHKVHMVVGITLTAFFLITLPIIVWLILRYRRRPIQPSNSANSSDKCSRPLDPEGPPDSSTLDLLEPDTPGHSPTSNNPSAFTETTRQVWAIVGGQKRLVTVPRYSRPGPPAASLNPLTSPIIPARYEALPHFDIPGNETQSNNSSSPASTMHVDTLSRGNIITSHTTLSHMHSHRELNIDATRLAEKLSRPSRQRPIPEPQPLSPPEDFTTRIFIPGRAVDMGPLWRGDVDDNGLLPPDYSQAMQPISSQRSPQAGPSAR
jgi:hypothetical protein